MINENLITEYSGTSFDVQKVDGVSRITYADNETHILDNIERGAVVYSGDCEGCVKLYENATWGNVLVIGLGLGILPQYIKDNKNPDVIDVLDNNQELIDYVDYLHSDINIIKGDAYTYTPDKLYDIIIVDLHWSEDEVTQQNKQDLTTNYDPHLKSGGVLTLPITGQSYNK